jgi:hypothetical protein
VFKFLFNSKLPDPKSDINTERTHIPTDSNNDISDDEIISLVLQECKKGDYKMIIIPIDIWDLCESKSKTVLQKNSD